MLQEIWKDILGFEGYYQVSNLGNVKSLSRYVSKYEYRPGKILKLKLAGNVYKVGLTRKDGSTSRDYRIDDLVARAFVKGYANGLVVNHIDNNQANNRADNLKWVDVTDYRSYSDSDNLPNEIWKDIKGYKNLYQVSNMGRVRSLPRRINNILYRGDILNLYSDSKGYLVVSLRGKRHPVHRLVAIAFCDGYAEKLVVNHKDEDKKNNMANNLEWVSPDYNKFYGTAMIRAKNKIKLQINIRKKLNDEKREIRRIQIKSKHQQEFSIVGSSEIWVDIKGYESLYQISSWGRVKTMSRQHPSVRGGFYLTKEKFLTPRKHSNGYLNVQLSKDGKKQNHYIHRLVAMAFLRNDNPNEYTDVNHINEDKTDNHVTNLEWCAHIYNTAYGTRNERMLNNMPPMKDILAKRNNPGLAGAEKPVLCIDVDGCIVAEYRSIMAASRATGYSAAKICQCCKGKRNKTGGYHWQYCIKE